ncbi:MAG: EamA family transporter [Caldilineaceae bacterium]|nr:EamA family transporter [Caldilineaceae bacterium]
MSAVALSLVLTAAFLHAAWNFLSKRVGASGPAFVWLFSALTVVIYLPLVIGLVIMQRPQITGLGTLFMAGSALLQLVYFLLLQRGYQTGDLSVIYPLARGSGPALSTLAAILLLGERPSLPALTGAGLVIGGVFWLSGGSAALRRVGGSQTLIFGLLTGATIAVYTLWDKVAVSNLLIPPLLLDYATAVGRTLFLAPAAYHRRERVRYYWSSYRNEALGIAILSPLAYILVLTALQMAPVSYVAPMREISVLIAVLMGAFLLKEGELRRRLAAAAVIVVGVVVIALN